MSEQEQPPPDVMTPEQVATYLQVTSTTVYNKLRAGKLPGAKIGKLWRIRKADLDAMLSGDWTPKQKAEPTK